MAVSGELLALGVMGVLVAAAGVDRRGSRATDLGPIVNSDDTRPVFDYLLTLIERLTLIVGQFDLTFRIAEDGRRLALVDIPDDLGIVRNYPGGPQPDLVAQKYRNLIPLAQVKVVDDRVYVKGLLDEKENMTQALREM